MLKLADMTSNNGYIKNSKISEAKFRETVKLFSFDLTAKQTSQITKLNRNTLNRLYRLFRARVADMCKDSSPFKGEIEVDES
jgi:hypothetical protein